MCTRGEFIHTIATMRRDTHGCRVMGLGGDISSRMCTARMCTHTTCTCTCTTCTCACTCTCTVCCACRVRVCDCRERRCGDGVINSKIHKSTHSNTKEAFSLHSRHLSYIDKISRRARSAALPSAPLEPTHSSLRPPSSQAQHHAPLLSTITASDTAPMPVARRTVAETTAPCLSASHWPGSRMAAFRR